MVHTDELGDHSHRFGGLVGAGEGTVDDAAAGDEASPVEPSVLRPDEGASSRLSSAPKQLTDDEQMLLPSSDSEPREREQRPSVVNSTVRRQAPSYQAALEAFARSWGATSAFEAVQTACDDLRAQGKQVAAPVELTPLLNALKASRRSTDMAPRGRLHVSSDGWTIHTRSDLHWRRQRFTEAHEIGHVLLYEAVADQPALVRELQSPNAWLTIERLCNQIAAELLIPRQDLRAQLAARPLRSLDDHNYLYDRYLVSTLALLRRVTEVTPDTAVTLWAYDRAHPNGAAWRLSTSYTSARNLYFPNVSSRRLRPNLIDSALTTGSSYSDAAALDLDSRRYSGSIVALYPRGRAQPALPLHHGHRIPDEVDEGRMYLVHERLQSSPIMSSRRRKRLRADSTPPRTP